MKQSKNRIKQLVKSKLEFRDTRRVVLIASVALISVLIMASFLSQSQAQRSIVLEDNASIDQIKSNKAGSLILTNNNILPAFHDNPRLDICIYTDENSEPIITQSNLDERTYLGPGEVKDIDIAFDIPEEELERDRLQGEFKTDFRDHCPIRSERAIIVRSN